MTSQLTKKKCAPCAKDTPALKGAEIKKLRKQLGKDWKVLKQRELEKKYSFKNFLQALAFTNRVGKVAEAEGHHPDIYLTWGKVRLNISTHSIGGLSENDFILAAKADKVL